MHLYEFTSISCITPTPHSLVEINNNDANFRGKYYQYVAYHMQFNILRNLILHYLQNKHIPSQVQFAL